MYEAYIFAPMGIVFRQSIKTSLVIFSGALLGVFVTWLSTKYIPKQQLGFTRNLTTQALVLSQILLLGLSTTLYVNVHKYVNEPAKQKLLITLCMTLPALFAILFFMPYFFLKSWVCHHFQPADIPLIERYYYWLPVYVLLFIFQILLEQYLGSQMKVALSSFVREVVLRLLNISLILLFAFGFISFDFFVVGSIVLYLIPIVVYLIIALNIKNFGFTLKFGAFSKLEYKELIHFSWYHFLLVLAVILMEYMAAATLPLYDKNGLTSVAIYGVAVFLISFLQMPSKAMMMPTINVLAQAVANDDLQRARDIFGRSSINIQIATLLMALLICCNLDNAVTLISNGYGSIAEIFLILLLGRFVDLCTGLNDAILTITKYYKFNFYVSVVLIFILYALIRVLVPRFGVYGAAWSSTVTLVIYNITKYIYVFKKLKMQPFSINTIKVFCAGVPALVVGYFLPNLFSVISNIYIKSLADAVARSLLIVVFYLLMLLLLKPSADLTQYLRSTVKNRKLF